MKKLNKVAYNRLLIQAQEAKELDLPHLAEGVLSSIGPVPREDSEIESYSSTDLEKDIYNGLWKLAIQVIAYHDTTAIDATKVDEAISHLSEVVLKEVEASLNVTDKIGKFEPKLPGEK